MLEFVNGDVIRDYDSFGDIANQYEDDAKQIQEILASFSKRANEIAGTMSSMNQDIQNVSTKAEESSDGITGVAEDVTMLVGAISQIKEESDHNQVIAKELEGEVGRFERV